MTCAGNDENTMIRSERKQASSTECVTMTTVQRVRRCSARRRMFSFSRVMMSREENGSSRIRSSGSVTSARASSTLFFMPPESWDGKYSSHPAEPQVIEHLHGAGAQLIVDPPPGQLEREQHVAEGRAPREEGIVLKHE